GQLGRLVAGRRAARSGAGRSPALRGGFRLHRHLHRPHRLLRPREAPLRRHRRERRHRRPGAGRRRLALARALGGPGRHRRRGAAAPRAAGRAMSLDPVTLLAIALMALATYGTRIGGLLLADRLRLEGRGKAAFEAIPPAVLTAVIAPTLLATGPAETAAGLVTILAAFRLPLLGTVAVGVAALVLLRALVPA